MEEDYEQDNIIQWIFEKAFDQLTMNGNELFETPFDKIGKKTFGSIELYNIINKLTVRPINRITEYITNKIFQERFLFSKIKKKLYVQILLDDLEKIKILIQMGHLFDKKCLQLSILNNRIDILQFIIKNSPKLKLENQLLVYCCEFGYEDIYFYLRQRGLVPNSAIYNKAVLGNSLKIIQDINENFGISNKILTSGFQTNNTDIILYLVDVAIKDNVKICDNLINYPILNNNFKLLEELEKKNVIEWRYDCDLYYSALLSGTMEMIKHVESKIPNIHHNHMLDTSKTTKGQFSLLLEDMIYEIDHKKYFSHTMNYAIQSGSTDVVKYVYEKGYGITPSNFITAIRQGNTAMLKYLCDKYKKRLPFYLIHYFGINSYVTDKMAKAKILIDNGLLDLNNPIGMTINDYKKESAHIELISQTIQISEDDAMDLDYLMKYQLFFVPDKGFKFNHGLLTKTKICLELNMDKDLVNIFLAQMNQIDQQFVTDILFLFGNITQIQKLFSYVRPLVPRNQIIMEIMCYNQLGKLCYLMQNKLFSKPIIDNLFPVATMLADEYIMLLFQKLGCTKTDIKYLLLSGSHQKIIKWLDDNNIDEIEINKNILKYVLQLDNMEIIKRFKYPKNFLSELIDWAEEADLVEAQMYLKSVEICEYLVENNELQ
jgi:hypothetical protein